MSDDEPLPKPEPPEEPGTGEDDASTWNEGYPAPTSTTVLTTTNASETLP